MAWKGGVLADLRGEFEKIRRDVVAAGALVGLSG